MSEYARDWFSDDKDVAVWLHPDNNEASKDVVVRPHPENNEASEGVAVRPHPENKGIIKPEKGTLSFIDEMCVLLPGAETERSEMYTRYKEYCRNAGLPHASQKTFNRDIETSYPRIQRHRDALAKRRTWKGIKLCDGNDYQL